MKSLAGMLRLNKWQVDERSRELSALQEQDAVMARRDAMLERNLEHEKQVASESLAAAAVYPAYAQTVIAERKAITVERGHLAKRIDIARDTLRTAMAEVKKFEIAENNRKAREKAELKAKEDARLDEVALEGFRRKQDG